MGVPSILTILMQLFQNGPSQHDNVIRRNNVRRPITPKTFFGGRNTLSPNRDLITGKIAPLVRRQVT
jgi:hypothetical protein